MMTFVVLHRLSLFAAGTIHTMHATGIYVGYYFACYEETDLPVAGRSTLLY